MTQSININYVKMGVPNEIELVSVRLMFFILAFLYSQPLCKYVS